MRLLLVEDNSSDQMLVERGFADASAVGEPVELTTAETVDDGLALLGQESFACVLVDYALPGRNGLDFLRALREAGDPTPAVFLTGTNDVTIAVAALQEGAADFLVKDIAFERALPVVVRRVLDKHATALADRQERSRLREQVQRLEHQLDTQTRELRRALQESEALRRVGQSLALAREPSGTLDLVSRTAAQLLQAQAAAVVLKRGTDDVLVSAWGRVHETLGRKHADLTAALSAGWGATRTAPLREERDVIGMLWVGRTAPGPFATHEIEVLEALSDLTALSIAQLRDREQVRRLRSQAAASPGMPAPADVAMVPDASETVATPTPADEPTSAATSDAASDAEVAATSERTSILVVDDSEKVLMQARLALQETMTVLTATSGKLALEKYAATRPAAVLVDLAMPDMDGFATIAELLKLGCSTCVALALRGDTHAHERARQAGCVAVIEKPFGAADLAQQLAAVLGAAAAPTPDHLSEDDGYPVLTLPDPTASTLPKLLAVLDRDLRSLAEHGNDRLIVDGTHLTAITPEHVRMLVRVFSEAGRFGIRTAICVPAETVVTKLRQIVEIRDARYVASRDAAKQCLQ